MSVPLPLFHRDGDRFVPTALTAGPWSPDAQHGGPPSGLLAHCIEQHDNGEEMFVARITVELMRPVPLRPLTVAVRTTRPGRKLQLIEASLWADGAAGEGTEVCRAVGLRLRRSAVDLPASVEEANAAIDARDLPPVGPDGGQPPEIGQGEHGFFAEGADLRFVSGAVRVQGPGMLWARLRQPLIDDEVPTGVVRAVTLSDFGNAAGAVVPMDTWTFINADLTVSLHREPVGEWICLDGVSRVSSIGVGLAACTLHDTTGPIGRTAQSLIVAPR